MSNIVSGFFGKLPARGDFVERRLSRAFVEGWDGWLQRAIASSQQELADAWLDTYLTSPVWTFASSAGVFGPAACLGVYMPSVDKVGRYYPMTIALEMPQAYSPWSMLSAAGNWAAEAEQVLFSLLGEDVVELAEFDEAVAALSLSTEEVVQIVLESDHEKFEGPLQCQIADANVIPLLDGQLAEVLSGAELVPHTLWCTPGSEIVSPSLLIVENVPDETAYPALLDGRWPERGWSTRDISHVGQRDAVPGESAADAVSVLASSSANISAEATSLTADIFDLQDATADVGLDSALTAVESVVEPGSLGIEELGIFSSDEPAVVLSNLADTAEHLIVTRPLAAQHQRVAGSELKANGEGLFGQSAAVTHKGNVRKANQDACDGQDHLGAWIVADGVGGHGAGELASALAVRVLEELPLRGPLVERAETLQGGLRLVEQALLAIGERYGDVERSATTVVALLQDADQVVLAWAGDSRIYRIRNQTLTQLTDDHSAPEVEGYDQSNVITRAVGGEDPVELELRYETLQSGDRFVLCSDGVYRELEDDELLQLSGAGQLQQCCDALQQRILATPAKDNFTALLVEFTA